LITNVETTPATTNDVEVTDMMLAIVEAHLQHPGRPPGTCALNAAHIKHMPGRKTDVKDAEWLADLLRHGLLRSSFVPPEPQRDLRDLSYFVICCSTFSP
jgi:hypothetical protein